MATSLHRAADVWYLKAQEAAGGVLKLVHSEAAAVLKETPKDGSAFAPIVYTRQ